VARARAAAASRSCGRGNFLDGAIKRCALLAVDGLLNPLSFLTTGEMRRESLRPSRVAEK
jgi:acyl-CoA synthetase (NDP forming)